MYFGSTSQGVPPPKKTVGTRFVVRFPLLSGEEAP